MNAANVSARIGHIREIFAQLPGVEAEADTAKPGLRLRISGHPPLTQVQLSWPRRNRFWSRDYDMVYTAELPLAGRPEFQVSYSFARKRFEPAKGCRPPQPLLDALNSTPLLAEKLARVDLTRLELTAGAGRGRVTLSSLPGSIVSLLIPPVTYAIKPKPEELLIHLELLQLLLSMLSHPVER